MLRRDQSLTINLHEFISENRFFLISASREEEAMDSVLVPTRGGDMTSPPPSDQDQAHMSGNDGKVTPPFSLHLAIQHPSNSEDQYGYVSQGLRSVH